MIPAIWIRSFHRYVLGSVPNSIPVRSDTRLDFDPLVKNTVFGIVFHDVLAAVLIFEIEVTETS
jgi:hypothetical protein